MNRSMFALAVCVLCSTAAAGCRRAADVPEPEPAALDACTAALAPGAQDTTIDHAIEQAQVRARGRAHTKDALERLGYLYVARARVAHDAGDYKLAEMAADCLALRYPDTPAASLLRGHVLHQQHRFAEAEQMARALVARREVSLDYGLLGDALMEQGRIDEAAAAYQKMIDLKPFYQSYVRAAHLRWLKGNLEGAIALMRLAVDSASAMDPESAAWAWTRLSAYELQAGRLPEALAACNAALRRQPGYAAALLARGRVLIAMHRTAEAIQALDRAARLNPLPEYQWALADSLRLQGLADRAEQVERELTRGGAAADPRTLALYLSTRRTDTTLAVRLTQEELRSRHDVFTLDAYAWALAANGRNDEARQVMSQALAEGTRDARLFLHAGGIEAASGNTTGARKWLKQAEHLRAMLLPSESAELSRQLIATRQRGESQ
jgi:tetratricopeptide (TPR) repeat protein